MELLKRIVLTVAFGLLILTTGLGTTAYALAMDGNSGHCAEHMSMLRDAKSTTDADSDMSQHEMTPDFSDGEHEKCKVHMCPGLTVFSPQMSVGMVRFDVVQTRFESDLRHLNQIETPDRPPNT
jgi:hypothetical protein